MSGKIFIKNNRDLSIVKCCCSCERSVVHSDKKTDKSRFCLLDGSEHVKAYSCENYRMKENLKYIELKPTGRIKKPHYFRWLLKELDELESIKNNSNVRHDIKSMIVEYEKKYGSRYM